MQQQHTRRPATDAETQADETANACSLLQNRHGGTPKLIAIFSHKCARSPSVNSRVAALLSGCLLLHAPPAAAQACSPVGYWTSTMTYGANPGDQWYGLLVGYFMLIKPDMTGTLKLTYCTSPHMITVTGAAPSFHISSSGNPDCGSFAGAFDVTIAPSCDSMSGTWVNDWGGGYLSGWTRNSVSMEQMTTSSTRVSGLPLQGSLPSGSAPGSFDFGTSPLAGPKPPTANLASGMTATSNPTTLNLVAAGPQRIPTPGGLSQLISNYTLNYPSQNPAPGTLGATVTTNDKNKIAAFGMSCYMVALESDYGTPPNKCTSTRINGVRYAGAVTNPNGLTGTYCSSFIANVKLQGTGQLNSGTYINYSPATQTMTAVATVTGADGTPVVAGQTVARDRAIIPGIGVRVDVDGVGTNLLANDTGGAIRGYRLDLFNGAGVAVCASYPNPIAIGTCTPEQTGTCPGRTMK